MREKVMQLGKQPITCECCGHTATPDKWRLSKTAIHTLVLFYKLGAHFRPTTSHAVKLAGDKGQGEVARLMDFGLVEKVTGPGVKRGTYRITDHGLAFLEGRETVPEYIWTFGAHRLIHISPKRLYIKDVVEAFDLDAYLHVLIQQAE